MVDEARKVKIEISEAEAMHLTQMLTHTTSSRRELLSGKEAEVLGIDTTNALEYQNIEEIIMRKILSEMAVLLLR